jgi:hypothetical protein
MEEVIGDQDKSSRNETTRLRDYQTKHPTSNIERRTLNGGNGKSRKQKEETLKY